MRLATLRDGSRDGKLVVVSEDGLACAHAPVATLQQALEDWEMFAPILRAIDEFNLPLVPWKCCAPLPRAWQWLDASAYPSHSQLMDKAMGTASSKEPRPLMYQGMSDTFYAPYDDIPFVTEALGIDFEGEFGVVVDTVPMGTTADVCRGHIRLLVQINDWSLRSLAAQEMKSGFGWIQAKPPCSMAPFAVTPEELGDAWRDGRICADLIVEWNGRPFGAANGEPMQFGFHELVAHACATRDLVAGTIIGSGTVSNSDYHRRGSSCIAERRGIEIVEQGMAHTEYMRFGDRVTMRAKLADGRSPFGIIDQTVVKSAVATG